MSTRTTVRLLRHLRVLLVLLATVAMVSQPAVLWAGVFGRNTSVGGVSINVEGVVGPPSESGRHKMLAHLRKVVKEAPGEMRSPVEMRMVSLRALEAACDDAVRHHMGRLPDEVRFLAGLQRIQYIFVYPERGDIVLAGPGEGWRVDDSANVVGITTGRPVLRLDDLMAALRHVDEARTVGISCSIDPTEAGARALQTLLNQQRGRALNPRQLAPAMKRAFGAQQVSISGIPDTSHFARVLVAADYRMKRMAMNLQKAPVKGLPSYLDMIKGSRRASNVNPRWWMACNYEPVETSVDGLAWELRGPGVKVMTEDELVSADGTVTGTGRASAPAQRWADLMTDKYDQLSVHDAVFGELRNLMDMCVVAALIQKHDLAGKAHLQLPVLADKNSKLELEVWNAPRQVPPEVSFLRAGNAWTVSASGGVQVESWQVASRQQVRADLAEVRQRAQGAGKNALWWQ